MSVQTRHLRVAPEPQENAVVLTIDRLHLLNAAIRNRQELERVLITARRVGNEAYAKHAEDAVRSLHLAERRARDV